MSEFLDEVAADVNPEGRKCRTCLWLAEQADELAADVRAALTNPAFSARAIAAAMKKRGFPGSQGSVENHRRAKHV